MVGGVLHRENIYLHVPVAVNKMWQSFPPLCAVWIFVMSALVPCSTIQAWLRTTLSETDPVKYTDTCMWICQETRHSFISGCIYIAIKTTLLYIELHNTIFYNSCGIVHAWAALLLLSYKHYLHSNLCYENLCNTDSKFNFIPYTQTYMS